MTEYLSGAEVLGEARLRRNALGKGSGILIVEGSDDIRLLESVCVSLDHVIPAGAKWKVLDAAQRIKSDEQEHFIHLVDCDYEVPAGLLVGKPHLVLTENPDAEADMVALGVIKRIVVQLVPSAGDSQAKLDSITERVLESAVDLAEAVGKMRYVSRCDGMNLLFEDLKLQKFRSAKTGEIAIEKLARTVIQRSDTVVQTDDLLERTRSAPNGLPVCNGHDLVKSIGIVLRQDFKVANSQIPGIPTLIRATVSPEFLGDWSVIQRIRSWEAATGSRVLA